MSDVVVLFVAMSWDDLSGGTLEHSCGRCVRDLGGDEGRGHDGREGHEGEEARAGPPGIASRDQRAGGGEGGLGDEIRDREVARKVGKVIGCAAVEERGPLGKHVYGGGHDGRGVLDAFEIRLHATRRVRG